MTDEHPNVALLKRLDLGDIAGAAELFASDVVFHYFNPRLPDVEGDYIGLAGIRTFFEKIDAMARGTFQVEPISITAVGDELIVTHTRNRMTLHDKPIATDVVVVWRAVDGRITEVWDIPSVHTVPLRQQN
jgi:ketosteroid isomerase-like protein